MVLRLLKGDDKGLGFVHGFMRLSLGFTWVSCFTLRVFGVYRFSRVQALHVVAWGSWPEVFHNLTYSLHSSSSLGVALFWDPSHKNLVNPPNPKPQTQKRELQWRL